MKMLSHSSYTSSAAKKKKKKVKDTFTHVGLYLLGLLIVIILAINLVRFFGLSTAVIDQSMNPTFESEDTVLVNRLSYAVGSPSRMDLIAMRIGTSENSPVYIRRIIGRPGETVKINGGKVYVNDEEISLFFNDERIADGGVAKEGITLEDEQYFVLCDDFNNSKDDSRLDSIGTVSSSQIVGKVWLVLSPFSHFSFVH